jgi:NTE family protein
MTARGVAHPRLGLVAPIAALAALWLVGCASARAVNVPLEQYDPEYGYRYIGGDRRDPGAVHIYLAFSGGGTRAAAFAYGVLEELRDTQVTVGGVSKSLLDEVDTISGVSGGSFPAAYYGLFGDRIFEDFEERFLKKNVQGALVLRTLLPWNLLRLVTPWLTRSDLARAYYDEHVFDHATFADLHGDTERPWVYINATDLSSGDRVTFTQDNFDLICSDLEVLSVSTAVAASSAVPMLLSPITLKNNAGSCGYEPPQWILDVLENQDANPRRARAAKNFMRFRNADEKPYIHLIDGGISDNLGLRPAIDFVSVVGSADVVRRIRKIETPDTMIVIVVNAETDPDPTIDLSSAAPSFASLMNSVSGGQIRRYNFETILLTESLLQEWGHELSEPDHEVKTYMVNVGFDRLEDEGERRYFKRIPTSFTLSDEQVERLRAAGRRLLRESPDFQHLVRSLR